MHPCLLSILQLNIKTTPVFMWRSLVQWGNELMTFHRRPFPPTALPLSAGRHVIDCRYKPGVMFRISKRHSAWPSVFCILPLMISATAITADSRETHSISKLSISDVYIDFYDTTGFTGVLAFMCRSVFLRMPFPSSVAQFHITLNRRSCANCAVAMSIVNSTGQRPSVCSSRMQFASMPLSAQPLNLLRPRASPNPCAWT